MGRGKGKREPSPSSLCLGHKEPPALNQTLPLLFPVPALSRKTRKGRAGFPVLCCVRRWNQIETELTHVVLNPTHVARYQVNTLTLGTLCSPRMR